MSGTAINFGPAEAAAQVRRIYWQGEPFQWLIELLRNALQVLAKNVKFGVVITDEKEPRLIRYVVDDGPGLDPLDLEAYFLKFGVGAGSHGGMATKFGIGSRVSTLPWNENGVVIVSKHASMEHPFLIRMFYNTKHKDGPRFEVQEHFIPGKGSHHVVAAEWYHTVIDPSIKWHELIESETGFAVVLMGNEDSPHTAMTGDSDRPEENANLQLGGARPNRYLNARMIQLPDYVESIKIDIVENIDDDTSSRASTYTKVTVDDKLYRLHTRVISGFEGAIKAENRAGTKESKLKAHDTVVVDEFGTEVDWYLLRKKRDGKVGAGDERIDRLSNSDAVLVGYEQDGILEAYERYDRNRLKMFGLYGPVLGRVRLVIRPPKMDEVTKEGVMPDSSRSGLQWGLSKPLPWEQWGESFMQQMPEELEKARDEEIVTDKATDKAVLEALKELKAFHREWWTQKLAKLKTGGKERIEPTEGGKVEIPELPEPKYEKEFDTSGKSEVDKPLTDGVDGSGTKEAEETETKSGTLEFKFASVDGPYLAELYPNIHKPTLLTIDPSHKYFTRMVEKMSAEYVGTVGDVVLEQQKIVMALQLVDAVEDVLRSVKEDSEFTTEVQEVMLSPGGLTMKGSGLWDMEQSVRRRVSQRVKKKTAA
jgi:hypothetical protein